MLRSKGCGLGPNYSKFQVVPRVPTSLAAKEDFRLLSFCLDRYELKAVPSVLEAGGRIRRSDVEWDSLTWKGFVNKPIEGGGASERDQRWTR